MSSAFVVPISALTAALKGPLFPSEVSEIAQALIADFLTTCCKERLVSARPGLPSGLEAYEAYGLEAGSQILRLGECDMTNFYCSLSETQ